MAIDRRSLLTAAAGGLAWLAAPALPRAAAGPAFRYLGARRLTDGSFVATLVDDRGRELRTVPLPGRGHGLAVRPDGAEAVAMARRPGTFAMVFPLQGEGAPRVIRAQPGRHFEGHAVFAPDGNTLLATENDYDNGRGVIGLYDPRDGYRRRGEYVSHGLDSHELVLLPGGRTLAVANGGILTHPDSGRMKLNLHTMAPSLTYLDLATGRLEDRWDQPAGRRSKLCIHHLVALPDGRVAFASQDQGDVADGLPLVTLHRPGVGAAEDLELPAGECLAMNGYCGSVAADRTGRVLAVSAPRGNRVVFWDLDSGRFLEAWPMADSCGIAAAAAPQSFALTNGRGAFVVHDPDADLDLARGDAGPASWDNHLLAVAG